MSETTQQTEIQFSLEKLYVKDISFEVPRAPSVFLEQVQQNIEVQVGINHRVIDEKEGVFEVVLQLTANAKNEEQSIFLAEVQQAGLFRILGVAEEQMLPVLEISCPTILLPYAREVVSSLVGHGGFPPFLINPINFENMFQQRYVPESA